MKRVLFLFLICFLSACSPKSIPPEITAIHDKPKLPPILQPKTEVIIVDAGHGGKDAGTCSSREGYEEKYLTLETAFLVCDCLKKLGYKTVMTRTHDVFVPLETRAEIANTLSADLFVSVHYNHSASPEAKGIEVFYYKEGKTPPSQRIVESKEFGSQVLKKIISHTGAESRGVKQANFAVVRHTHMPAILIEAGFLSNPAERCKIKDQKYQHTLAQGIAHGIDQYLSSKKLAKK